MMGWQWGPGMGWGVGGIWMILVWGLLIVGAVIVARWLLGGASSYGRGTEESPRDILRRRYARGEIDREEYEARRRDLMQRS